MDELKGKIKAQAQKVLDFDESLLKGMFGNATPEEIKQGRQIMLTVSKLVKEGKMKDALKYLETKRNEFGNGNR